jgi:predicted nuclease of predicted toxin-antitoxin system
MLADFEVEARKQLGARDPENWPVLATALALDCSIWTEDTDFFGCGVATWTSGSIEIFLLTWSSVGPETLRIQLRRPQPKHHSEPLAELRKLFVLPKRCLHCNKHIGRRLPAFPVTPPYVRVRIRRFGGLSYRPPVNLGIPRESK